MPKSRLPLLIALCASATALAGGGAVESTFDADDEGWDTLNDARDFTWTDEFGNPGGSIRANDVGTGAYWFFAAPSAYLGDQSALIGGELSWDIYGIAGNQQITTLADVMLVGGGVQIGINVPVEPVDEQWTSWGVVLDGSSPWFVLNSTTNGSLSDTPATQADIEAALADLQGLYIRGEYTVGGDSTAIDNVRLAPPPPCGDVTGDGNVDLADLNLVLAMFGMDTADGDANGDGTVNLTDLNLVLAQFGGGC